MYFMCLVDVKVHLFFSNFGELAILLLNLSVLLFLKNTTFFFDDVFGGKYTVPPSLPHNLKVFSIPLQKTRLKKMTRNPFLPFLTLKFFFHFKSMQTICRNCLSNMKQFGQSIAEL